MSLGNIEQRTEEMKKQVLELIEQSYQDGYKSGYKVWKNSAFDNAIIDATSFIEQGRNEAWRLALHIFRLNQKERKAVFGYDRDTVNVLESMDASEVLEKIRAYEEQKREETKIKVGDEVIYSCGNYKDKATVIDIDADILHLLTENGCYLSEEYKDVKKTGRHFTEIAELLKKLREEK